jgi:hypothetical protein
MLIGVKIFKKATRWRLSISNENLKHIKVKISQLNIDGLNPMIKKWTLTYMLNPKAILPTILIFRSYRKFMFQNAISEGLASYGFNVINIWFKNFQKSRPDLKEKDLDSIFKYHQTISLSENYFIQSIGKFNHLMNNFEKYNFKGLILINTKPNKINIEVIKSLVEKDIALFLIYSEFLIFNIKRRHLRKFQRILSHKDDFSLNIITIDNSKRFFKYYETILLGKIINIIKKKKN